MRTSQRRWVSAPSWLQVRGEKREWRTLPTAASPSSTSLTLLLGFGGGAVVSVMLPVEDWSTVGVAVRLIMELLVLAVVE